MEQILKNLKSVEAIDADRLRRIIITDDGVYLKYWRDFKALDTVGLSEMTVTSKMDGKTRVFTTTLSSHLQTPFQVQERTLCFRVTAVDGTKYLIGTSESPFPVVNTEAVFPSSERDKSGCKLTVELADTIGLLQILD